MDAITDVSFEKVSSSRFLKPLRMHFRQEGRARSWDVLMIHDSVCCLLYHVGRRALLLVRQFRPSVYAHVGRHAAGAQPPGDTADGDVCALNAVDWRQQSAAAGVTYELCAGIIDDGAASVEETAQREILEECGFAVPLTALERITSCLGGVGTSGARQTFFFAEVDDSMKVSEGGGIALEGERIELAYVPLDDGRKLMFNETIPKPVGMVFGLMWFYSEKAPQYLNAGTTTK